MSLFDSQAVTQLVENTGWVLLHFVWQGALVAVLVALALFHLRRASAAERYLVICTGMLAMLAFPVATFVLLSGGPGGLDAGVAASTSFGAEGASWFDPSGALPLVVLAWSLGSLFLLSRTVLQWASAWRLVRGDTSAAPAGWQQVIEELRGQMGIRGPVRILATTRSIGPLMIGCLRPVILVPVVAFTGLTPDQLRAVLAHELAHVRRYDYLVNLVQTMIESLLFFHPGVWWLSSRLRAEREFCCDDLAVRVSGDTLCYVRALSVLDEMRDEHLRPAMASNGGSLMTRITRLIGAPAGRPRRIAGWLAPAMFALTLTAAASAVTVSLPADLGQDPAVVQVKQDKQDKQKQDKQEAKKKRDALIRKLRAEGLSEEEIERVLAQMQDKEAVHAKKYKESKNKVEQERKRAQLKTRIAEMRAKGMSDEEIERAIVELRHREQDSAAARKQREHEKQKELWEARVAKLRAAGLSDAEIRRAVAEMMREEEAIERQRRDEDRAREIEAKRDAKIREMQEEGMSPDQIRQALEKLDIRRKDAVRQEHLQELHDALQQRIDEMRSRGATEVEIKKRVEQWKREHQVKLETSKHEEAKARAHARRAEMIEEMRARGMSKEEIHRRLQELEKKDLEKQMADKKEAAKKKAKEREQRNKTP